MNVQVGTLLFVVAMLAGAVNSVAGGGTLLTFPTLLMALHNNGLVANATSTVALWPGQLSSLFGYRKEIGKNRDTIAIMALPSLVGGGIGAVLLLHTSSSAFARIVPFLILLATVLFMTQEPLSRYLKSRKPEMPESAATEDPVAGAPDLPTGHSAAHPAPKQTAARTLQVVVFQLLVAVYGGYFGAGIGILMLAALGFLGFSNIHTMNGIKNINGLCINAVAISLFVFGHTLPGNGVGAHHNSLIHWPIAVLMTAGSIIGGYSGAGAARKIGQKNVRSIIIIIGFALTLSLLIKR
jgi:uncharacterized membrane protein YfcA